MRSNIIARRKIVVEKIEVHNNGDRSGKGELYWDFDANSQTFAERSRKNILKVKDGEVVSLGDHLLVSSLENSDTLTISGHVSEKDGAFSGSDETAKFTHIYSKSDNWGIGNYKARLKDGPLDVSLSYRIETY